MGDRRRLRAALRFRESYKPFILLILPQPQPPGPARQISPLRGRSVVRPLTPSLSAASPKNRPARPSVSHRKGRFPQDIGPCPGAIRLIFSSVLQRVNDRLQCGVACATLEKLQDEQWSFLVHFKCCPLREMGGRFVGLGEVRWNP